MDPLAASDADGVLRTVSLDMVLEQGATLQLPGIGPHAWVEAGASGRVSLELPPRAQALLVELQVHDGDGTLLLQAIPPSARDQSPLLADSATLYARQQLDGTAHLIIDGPEPGTWSADAHADGFAQRMRFTVYATSFDGPVPDGFTAIPQ